MKSSTKVISKVEAEKRIMALVKSLKDYLKQNQSCGLESLPSAILSRYKLSLLGHILLRVSGLENKVKLKAAEEFYGLVRANIWSSRVRFNALVNSVEKIFDEFKETCANKLPDSVYPGNVEKLAELLQEFMKSLAALKKG